MEMGKKTLAVLLALGLMLCGCTKDANPQATTASTTETTAASNSTLPKPVSGNLICEEISRYTGNFVEDGTGRPVQDVAAIRVANNTGKFLQLAMITYKVGDRKAEFVVTDLPAGGKVWIMESNALTLEDGDELVLDKITDTYNTNAITSTDDIAVTRQGKSLTLTNKTNRTLKNVAVYYKLTQKDGTFFGGITYLISFDNLEAGASATKAADHFGENATIVRFAYE